MDSKRVIAFGHNQKPFAIHSVIACFENMLQEYTPDPKAHIEREYYSEHNGKKTLVKESYSPNIDAFASMNCLWGAIISIQLDLENESTDEYHLWQKKRGALFLNEANRWFGKELTKYYCLMDILREYCSASLKAFKAKKITAIELFMDVIEVLSK